MDGKAAKNSHVLAFTEDLLDIERLDRPKGIEILESFAEYTPIRARASRSDLFAALQSSPQSDSKLAIAKPDCPSNPSPEKPVPQRWSMHR
jgi:hypothetical protein